MPTVKTDGLPWRVMHLAARPEGVCMHDVTELERRAYFKVMSKLMDRKCVTRKINGRLSHYFATAEQLDAYKSPAMGPRPAAAHECRPAQAFDRNQRLTINPKRPPGKVPWSANAPIHLPYDDAGRPLWKFTACPGFTGDPIKTNTFTGAY